MPEYGITPLLSEERADEPDGLWATKQYGDFQVNRTTWCTPVCGGRARDWAMARRHRHCLALEYFEVEA